MSNLPAIKDAIRSSVQYSTNPKVRAFLVRLSVEVDQCVTEKEIVSTIVNSLVEAYEGRR